jgi:opacity protein-like surface antigen
LVLDSSGGRDGYTVGGGLEYLFAPNWSGKIEYQFYDFGRRNFTFVQSRRPQRGADQSGPELPFQLRWSDRRI